MGTGTVLLIVLILVLIGVLPTWPRTKSWGYGPSGIVCVGAGHSHRPIQAGLPHYATSRTGYRTSFERHFGELTSEILTLPYVR